MSLNLPKEVVDLETSDNIISVSVDSLEGSEWLEVSKSGEKLSLSFNLEFKLSNSLEELLQLVL